MLASWRSFEALAARVAVYQAHEHQINALYWQLVQIVALQAFELRHALANMDCPGSDAKPQHSHSQSFRKSRS
ncbi:MAG TPA: hypothetical protein PLB32_26715, partial [Acidobacteriota bacterium]|nr:hypothetical protein [Acidobacteriota bacterium]